MFESSDEITYRDRGLKKEEVRVEDAVADDLETNFHDAATTAIKRIAPRLKLGYKTLE